jgi:hypothetical protein
LNTFLSSTAGEQPPHADASIDAMEALLNTIWVMPKSLTGVGPLVTAFSYTSLETTTKARRPGPAFMLIEINQPGDFDSAAVIHNENAGQNMNVPFHHLELPQSRRWISQETSAEWFKQRIRILRCNPAFPTMAVNYAQSVVDLFKGRYLANRAMANVARQTICTAILSLYFEQPERTGPFLSSIQNLTTAMRLCSRNTAAANVVLLERVGLVTRMENSEDRRWRHIVPTEQLMTEVEGFLRVNLAAADMLFPARGYCALLDESRHVLERCFANSIHSLLVMNSLDLDLQGSEIFNTSDGGKILLLKLMSMRDASQLVDEDTVEFPYDEVGTLFGLSRTHVRRLMKKAETSGFVRLLQDGGRRVQILPPLETLFENVVASNVAQAQFDIHLANGDYDLLPVDPFA